MMRFQKFPLRLSLWLLCMAAGHFVWGQAGNIETLQAKKIRLERQPAFQKDTAWLNTINELAYAYSENFPDSALYVLKDQRRLCREAGYPAGEAGACINEGLARYNKGDYNTANEILTVALSLCKTHNLKTLLQKAYNNSGLTAMAQGNYSAALQFYYQSLEAAEAVNDLYAVGIAHNNIAIVNYYQGQLDEAEKNYTAFLNTAIQLHDTDGIVVARNNIGEVYLDKNEYSQALGHFKQSLAVAKAANKKRSLVSSYKNLGLLYFKMDSLAQAAIYFKEAAALAFEIGNKPSACISLTGLAKTLHKQGQYPEALRYATQALEMSEQMGQPTLMRDAHEITASIYESMGNGLKALQHYRQFKLYADSLKNSEADRLSERLKASFEFSKKELAFERQSLQQRWLIFSAFGALFTLFVIVWIVNRNRKRTKQANTVLQQKNQDIENQKTIAEKTLVQLQATQKQLVQAEKMASLGELTAGIAHEIQNPLNFVNNFSEVSTELVQEMQEEAEKGNTEAVKAISADLVQNLEKITHHGKRADAIVKGMLQHSRSSSGVKEPTDINALADEYLRLAYHGLRAKEKSFNARLKTDYDALAGTISIIPQDIGRVLLNLITNAFYAVNEKLQQQPGGFEPAVEVTTKKTGDAITITVKDNGNGIPEKIRGKIFQPFFTTKPSGQGTGLGLSLSYDIVKAHGGELSMETAEGAGTAFIITLPI